MAVIELGNMCFNCFVTKPDGDESCPYCGYNHKNASLQYPTALTAGGVLNGQYIVGRVLGQGGFGITYLALDYNLKMKVAIKEYLPDGMATRLPETTLVSVYVGEKEENFRYGAERFLDEARVLAKFVGNRNIISVRTYFTENNTSYFVMDFVDGISFKTYLKNNGGKVSYQKAMEILIPVLDALAPVHKEGFIHRDVTPDNIYITKDNEIKLLDFGSARYSLGNKSKSLDVILKAGYAPKEQYMRRGKQGTYTDIYSLAACFYASISGYLPPESLERMENDEIVILTQNGFDIPKAFEDVIMKGLAVQPENRYQSAEEFKDALLLSVSGSPPVVSAPQAEPVSEVSPASAEPEVAKVVSVNVSQGEIPATEAQISGTVTGSQPSDSQTPAEEKEKQSYIDKLKILLTSLKKISENHKKAVIIGGSVMSVIVFASIYAAIAAATSKNVPTAVEINTDNVPGVLQSAGQNGSTSAPQGQTQEPDVESQPVISEPEKEVPKYDIDLVIDFLWDEVTPFDEYGIARVKSGSNWGLIDMDGNLVSSLKYSGIDYFFEGYATMVVGNRCGYLDTDGMEVISPEFDMAYQFCDGIAKVIKGGKTGYIDYYGNLIIPAVYSTGSGFVNGYAAVSDRSGYFYIDETGYIVSGYVDQANMFSEGLAAVKSGGKWGFADTSFKLVIPFQFDEVVESFVDGKAIVQQNGKQFFIDEAGNVLSEKVDQLWKFSDGFATALDRGEYGFIDESTGYFQIPPQYPDVLSFSEGLCPVSVGKDEWVYINAYNEVQFDGRTWSAAHKFTNGYARVRDGNDYGIIDTDGYEVIPVMWEDIQIYSQDMVPVKNDGRWGYFRVTKNY